MKGARSWAVGLVLSAAAVPVASADEVFLVGGGRIAGEVVDRRAEAIVIETGPGRVTLPASRVAKVVSGTSAVAVYRDRAARLNPRDVEGWVGLGVWAQDNGLLTLAGDAFQHVVTVDAGNETAHRALGHVRIGGQWMSEEDGYRARGFVNYEGAWMSRDEAQMAAAQRAAEAEARRADREVAAREREAEARVRIAEAEAARAQAEAESAAASGGGIPYPWVFGPSYGPYGPVGGVVVSPHRSGGARHGRRQGQDRRVIPPTPQRDRGARPVRTAPARTPPRSAGTAAN